MSLLPEQIAILRGFLKNADFMRGSVVIDLDGTVLQEIDGKVFISGSVEQGVRKITGLGRPVIMNTLRFPLSITRNIADEWMTMAAPQIPVVLLNGSIIGMISKEHGQNCFTEISSYPLEKEQITTLLGEIKELVENDIKRIDVFYYPRDWKKGEIIWSADSYRLEYIRKKYQSASDVISVPIDKLERRLLSEDICMISVLIDHPRDVLMAYQHQNPNDHFTRSGVNKSFGLRELARKMDIPLMDSLGAGDTSMDNFLNDTGLSVIVGDENDLPFRGRKQTLWMRNPAELGELLSAVADIVSMREESKKRI
jgi:hydroxymethylpyrimidine pyrophosphatase-like HAD family hydrolase